MYQQLIIRISEEWEEAERTHEASVQETVDKGYEDIDDTEAIAYNEGYASALRHVLYILNDLQRSELR